jgi:hypothetical protein
MSRTIAYASASLVVQEKVPLRFLGHPARVRYNHLVVRSVAIRASGNAYGLQMLIHPGCLSPNVPNQSANHAPFQLKNIENLTFFLDDSLVHWRGDVLTLD